MKILTLFCEKSASENGSEKWCPPRVKQVPLPGPGGSRTAPLACALIRTRNNNYSNNSNKKQQLKQQLQVFSNNCRSCGYMSVFLQRSLFHVSFISESCVKSQLLKHGCCLVFCFIPTCVIRFQLQKQNSTNTKTQMFMI